ncbi:MAG: hypothetical protein IRZ11_02055 [Clostridia bacterium]|nr:hypothetical protein [Clostridia bacterium]
MTSPEDALDRWTRLEDELAEGIRRRDLARAMALLDEIDALRAELASGGLPLVGRRPGEAGLSAWRRLSLRHEENLEELSSWLGEVREQLVLVSRARERRGRQPGRGRWLDRRG